MSDIYSADKAQLQSELNRRGYRLSQFGVEQSYPVTGRWRSLEPFAASALLADVTGFLEGAAASAPGLMNTGSIHAEALSPLQNAHRMPGCR